MGNSTSKVKQNHLQQKLKQDWEKNLQRFPAPNSVIQQHYQSFLQKGSSYSDTFIESIPVIVQQISTNIAFRHEVVNTLYLMMILNSIMRQTNQELVADIQEETPCEDSEEERERQKDNQEMIQASDELVNDLTEVIDVLEKINLTALAHPDTFESTMVEPSHMKLYEEKMEKLMNFLKKGRQNIKETTQSIKSLTQTMEQGFQQLEVFEAIFTAQESIPRLYRIIKSHIETILSYLSSSTVATTETEKQNLSIIIQKDLPSALLQITSEKNKLEKATAHIDISQPNEFLKHPLLSTSKENIESLSKEDKQLLSDLSNKNTIYDLIKTSSEIKKTASQLIAFCAQPRQSH